MNEYKLCEFCTISPTILWKLSVAVSGGASLHQAIFGSVDDDCLLDSFLMLLPAKKQKTMLIALEGTEPFPSEEIMDILDDFKETTMPLSSNLRKLVLKVATAEFITKPFILLL